MRILKFRLKAFKKLIIWKIFLTIIFLFCFLCFYNKLINLVILTVLDITPRAPTTNHISPPQPNITDWNFKVKKVYALVFYGRRKQASILLRYLEPNAKQNGGILDKIVFAVKTNNTEDLVYLETIMNQNKTYFERVTFSNTNQYTEIYSTLDDDDLIFKIDDDIVFIADGTFERMYDEYIENQLLFLSANVVNHPLLSYVHARMRAVLAFYEKTPDNWVRYKNKTEIDDTPATKNTYDAWGTWLSCDKCAAMTHHSFLYHAERNNFHIYDFKVWDFHSSVYTRWSINFVLMRGKYVNKIKDWFPDMDDDEVAISHKIPEILKKHAYALGSALVVHFSYANQYDYMKNTSILEKYDNFSKKYLTKKYYSKKNE